MNAHPAILTEDAVATLLVDTEPYLSCDDCFERIDQYVERRVADASHHDPEMDTHLAGCGVCAEEAATIEDLLREDAGDGPETARTDGARTDRGKERA